MRVNYRRTTYIFASALIAGALLSGCGGGAGDPCEDKEALKEEILAACQVWLREQLRLLDER